MHLSRKYRILGLKSALVGILVLLFFSNCEKPPQFSKTPVIEFDTLTNSIEFNPFTQTEVNKLEVTIRFQDGDGDLGVLSTDIGNIEFRSYSDTTIIPVDTSLVDGVEVITPEQTIYTFKNYYIDFFRKVDGAFIPIETKFSLDGTFEPLIAYDEVGPIEGTLSFEFELNEITAIPAGFSKNDTISFEVFVVDRSLNESNKIRTSEIVVFQ